MKLCGVLQLNNISYVPFRFHDPDNEPTMGHDVVPVLNDNVQVSVDQYRSQLYQVCYA